MHPEKIPPLGNTKGENTDQEFKDMLRLGKDVLISTSKGFVYKGQKLTKEILNDYINKTDPKGEDEINTHLRTVIGWSYGKVKEHILKGRENIKENEKDGLKINWRDHYKQIVMSTIFCIALFGIQVFSWIPFIGKVKQTTANRIKGALIMGGRTAAWGWAKWRTNKGGRKTG